MLLSELSSLITSEQFEEAARRVRDEKVRLKSESLSHPVIDLLRGFDRAHLVRNSSYMTRSQEEAQTVRDRMPALLEAMLDAGLPMGFLPARRSSKLTSDDEVRMHTGLGHNGRSSSSYDVESGTLYVRMAGVGWVEGMQILLRRGYQPKADEVDDALVNAIRCQELSSLEHILATHPIQGHGYWEYRNGLLGRLFRWEGVPASAVSVIWKAYSQERTHEWIKDSHNEAGTNSDTVLEWLSNEPGAWKRLHEQLLKEARDNDKIALSPGLWTTLFREYVRHGKYEALLGEALEDGLFDAWKDRPAYKEGVNLASWIVQGGPVRPPAPSTKDYKGDWTPEPPASHRAFAQLRRARRLLDRLAGHGMALRHGAAAKESSEAMDWAAAGRVPSRAFVHRHHEFLLPSASLSSPLHCAKTPEVALAWEALGASSSPNREGADPWVASMQASEAPAPWGREIASRLKDGRLALAAQGSDGKTLAEVSTRNPPLARFWLKKSKKAVPEKMFAAALKEEQWVLVREWVQEGALDNAPDLRVLFFNSVRSVSSKMSDASRKNWTEMVACALARPGRPWEEQAEAWRAVVPERSIYKSSASEETMRLLADWGPDEAARTLWKSSDWQLACERLRNDTPQDWLQCLPVEPTVEEGKKIFWHIMLNKDVQTNERRHLCEKVWRVFDCDLPVGRDGADLFKRMKKLDEAQYDGGFASVSAEFMSFLEAEEMASNTVQVAGPRATPSSRRL